MKNYPVSPFQRSAEIDIVSAFFTLAGLTGVRAARICMLESKGPGDVTSVMSSPEKTVTIKRRGEIRTKSLNSEIEDENKTTLYGEWPTKDLGLSWFQRRKFLTVQE